MPLPRLSFFLSFFPPLAVSRLLPSLARAAIRWRGWSGLCARLLWLTGSSILFFFPAKVVEILFFGTAFAGRPLGRFLFSAGLCSVD